MCKYCDYVFDTEVNDPMDLVASRFRINKVLIGDMGVNLIPQHKDLHSGDRVATIRLYVKPLNDVYFTQNMEIVNFCPMCGKDLRNLPRDEV